MTEIEKLEQQQLTQIISYYRNRVDAFDNDRRTFYAKMELIRPKQDLLHKAEWELRKRQEEKYMLSTALDQCQTVLFEEREKTLGIKTQCDKLQFKQKESKKQIRDILSSTNSVEQHVYLEKDQAPKKIQSYATKTNKKLAEEEQLKDVFKHKRVCTATGVSRSTLGAQGEPNILRTIHMPNQQASSVQAETSKLMEKIEQNRQHYESVINKLRDEKCAFEEMQREKYLKSKQTIDTLLQQIQQQETLNSQVVADHVAVLTEHELKERMMQEELEALQAGNIEMRREILNAQQKSSRVKDKAKQAYVSDTQEIQKQFADQDRIQHQATAVIKDQYRKVSEVYQRKMADMKQQIERDTSKAEVHERRRKCEIEGISSDLSNMKKKVEFYQKYILKLKQLVNEDTGGNTADDMEGVYSQIKEEASEMEQSPEHHQTNNRQANSSDDGMSSREIITYNNNN